MYKNILVPVLFDEGHDTQASYAVARKLADDGAKFTVIHVLEEIPNYVTDEIPTDILEKSRAEANEKLHTASLALPDAQSAMVHGHPGRAIVSYAAENDIDCIVIASHKLGFTDLFLGSTASRVVRHAPCSVHVIR